MVLIHWKILKLMQTAQRRKATSHKKTRRTISTRPLKSISCFTQSRAKKNRLYNKFMFYHVLITKNPSKKTFSHHSFCPIPNSVRFPQFARNEKNINWLFNNEHFLVVKNTWMVWHRNMLIKNWKHGFAMDLKHSTQRNWSHKSISTSNRTNKLRDIRNYWWKFQKNVYSMTIIKILSTLVHVSSSCHKIVGVCL